MEIEQSALFREIQRITSSGGKPVHYMWRAEIHANGGTYPAMKVLEIDTIEDFAYGFAAERVIRLAIPAGVYASKVYPFKNKLEITLFQTPIGEMSDQANLNELRGSERYSAVIFDTGNPIVEGNGINTPSQGAMDLTDIRYVDFQLLDKAVEQIRGISVGGIYRGTTNEDVIKATLTKESQQIRVDGTMVPVGVNMVSANNKVKREHVVIPQSLRLTLVDLPGYIQKNCGGVYGTGIGCYISKNLWWIWPLLDTTRFETSEFALTIINVPRNMMPGIERTYTSSGRNLTILSTGEVQFRDPTDSTQLTDGNGVRFTSANKIYEGFGKTKGNKTVLARGGNNSEFLSSKRPSGINIAKVSDNPINSNNFEEYSKLAMREGGELKAVWENSNPALIRPGMPVKFFYLDGEVIRELEGVLLHAHHHVEMVGNGLLSNRHRTNSALSLYVKKKLK